MDPVDEIGRICNDAEPDQLSRIAAVLGMDKVEARRDELVTAARAVLADFDGFWRVRPKTIDKLRAALSSASNAGVQNTRGGEHG